MQRQFREEQMLLKTLQRKIPHTILQKFIQHGFNLNYKTFRRKTRNSLRRYVRQNILGA